MIDLNKDYTAAMEESERVDAIYRDSAVKVEQEAVVWRAKWPHHCKSCQGWGGSSFTEMHGFKHGSGEQMFDPCEAIENPAVCHRCGEEGLTEDGEGPCKACNWNYDDGVPSCY